MVPRCAQDRTPVPEAAPAAAGSDTPRRIWMAVAAALVEGLPEVDAIVVRRDGKVLYSAGLAPPNAISSKPP